MIEIECLCANIFTSEGQIVRGEKIKIPADEAKAIAAADKAAKRDTRISFKLPRKAKKNEAG